MSRICGLDLGQSHTGIALSDSEGKWAFGRGTIEGSLEMLVNRLLELKKLEPFDRLVVGLPVPLAGGESGRELEIIKQNAAILGERLGLPVEYEEERFTSKLSRRLNAEAGKRDRDDEGAAVLILESYLTKNAR